LIEINLKAREGVGEADDLNGTTIDRLPVMHQNFNNFERIVNL
jgi:hypothetical protein